MILIQFAEGTYLVSKCNHFYLKTDILERLEMLEYPSLLYCSRYSSMTMWAWLISGTPNHVTHIDKHGKYRVQFERG